MSVLRGLRLDDEYIKPYDDSPIPVSGNVGCRRLHGGLRWRFSAEHSEIAGFRLGPTGRLIPMSHHASAPCGDEYS